jgi:tetratricopeptide (TPR) repeat protein
MHNLTRILPSPLIRLSAGILFMALSLCPQIHADDTAKPQRKPDVKVWKASREEGQKALEQKNYAQAEVSFTAALEEARNFDAQDYRLAESLVDLGRVYYLRGNVVAAEPLYRQAAEIRHGDPDPFLETDVVYDFGLVCERLGHYDDAAKAYQRAEEIMSRKVGRDNPETVRCTFRLAMVYYKQQKYAEAEPLLKRCFTQFKNPASKITFRKGDGAGYGMQAIRHIYRPNYAYALEAVSRLAQIYLHQNQLPAAEKCMKDALDLVDEYAGKGDPEIPAVLKEMSAFYFEMNNYAAAEPVLQRLAKIQEKSLGETNEVTLTTQDRLAGIYAQEKKPTEAEALYQKIVALQEKATGPESRETAVAVANLGKFYVTQEQYEKAEPLYRRQLEQTQKYQGDGIALTPILADQVVIYSKLGKDAELEAVYKHQIAIIEKMFGANTPALAKPLADCAQLLRKQKRDAEAEPLEARANALKAH